MATTRLSRDSREDARLVKGCREGDARAYELLVRKYQDPVFSIAYRMVGDREDARDLAQETFVRALEGIDTFNIRMPFRAWLFRICTNAVIDHLRKYGKVRDIPVEMAVAAGAGPFDGGECAVVIEMPGSDTEIPENISVANETAVTVREALMDLPEHYRAVVVLHHMEGMSYSEISRVMEVPRNTAKTWGHRARALLCDTLEGVV
jgi:RNA polymerase sigma-70 factor (ECF subfamily)